MHWRGGPITSMHWRAGGRAKSSRSGGGESMSRKPRPAGTIRLQVTVKNSRDGPEHHYEIVSTAKERRDRARQDAVRVAREIARARLWVVWETIRDVLGKESNAWWAEWGFARVNRMLKVHGPPTSPTRAALKMAISRLRRRRAKPSVTPRVIQG